MTRANRLAALVLMIVLPLVFAGCATLADRLDGSWRLRGRLDKKGKLQVRSQRKPTVDVTFDKREKTLLITQQRRRGKPIRIPGRWSCDEKSGLLVITVGKRVTKPVTLNVRFDGKATLILRNARRRETSVYERRSPR